MSCPSTRMESYRIECSGAEVAVFMTSQIKSKINQSDLINEKFRSRIPSRQLPAWQPACYRRRTQPERVPPPDRKAPQTNLRLRRPPPRVRQNPLWCIAGRSLSLTSSGGLNLRDILALRLRRSMPLTEQLLDPAAPKGYRRYAPIQSACDRPTVTCR